MDKNQFIIIPLERALALTRMGETFIVREVEKQYREKKEILKQIQKDRGENG